MENLLSYCIFFLIFTLAPGGFQSEAPHPFGTSSVALQKMDTLVGSGNIAVAASGAVPEIGPIWDKLSALAAVAGLVVSGIALIVAILGTRSSTRLSTEALQTARQANNIALGLVREPAIIEFSFSNKQHFFFDLTIPGSLNEQLKKIITIKNVGKKSIDSIAFEIIGIEGLTHLTSDITQQIKPLPFINAKLDLKTALQPGGMMHIDFRKYLLDYLQKLDPVLQDKKAKYTAVINVVLAPKAVDEPVPAGVPLHLTRDDRRLLTISFVPTILASPEAQEVLQESTVAHRVFD